LLIAQLLAIASLGFANPLIASQEDLAQRYVSSRPELYGAGFHVAIGVLYPPQDTITSEQSEATILRAAKALNQASDWNATHPHWKRVVERIRLDMPRLQKALREDPRLVYDAQSDEPWRQKFVETLAHELTENELQAIVDFYESAVGRRFSGAAKRVYYVAEQQQARLMIARANGEDYNFSALAEFAKTPISECEPCTLFIDRETLGSTGLLFAMIEQKELSKVWADLLSEKDRDAIQTFRLSPLGEKERKAMYKASHEIRAAFAVREFVRTRNAVINEISQPYQMSWLALMKD
jgi:hypothetical protein